MIRISNIKAPLEYDNEWITKYCCSKLRLNAKEIVKIELFRKSLDARNKNNIYFVLAVNIWIKNNKPIKLPKNCEYSTEIKFPVPHIVKLNKKPVVVGFGPAGMFAALWLAKSGANPIVLERGDDVDTRIEKVNKFRKFGILDKECNVQFGEGGAGTFSDGKLNTGINDPLIRMVLNEFVNYGAPSEILYDAKPHIGTDKLIKIVKNIRNEIIQCGGEVIFGAKLIDISDDKGKIKSIEYEKDGIKNKIETDKVILAIGHSARDIFKLLNDKNFSMEKKNFSVGVRIEHTREELNKSMYGEFSTHPALLSADYKLACHTPEGRGIYTFCMCPGGKVMASSSEENTIVTNGMSLYKRDDINSNSALLVSVTPNDIPDKNILSGMEFQRQIEIDAFKKAGSNYYAPICLVGDFFNKKCENRLGNVIPSYEPGTKFVLPDEYLPEFVCDSLRYAIPEFAKKISCFSNPDAVLTGPETRSSSPIRIIRDDSFQSISLKGLYPCGEGAGYAGGIMTAAIDGIKCAMSVCEL